MDGPLTPLARCGGVACGGRPPCVCGLDPRVPAVEREVVTRHAHTRGPIEARAVVDRERLRTCLLIDEVVGSGDEDVRGIGIHRHGRLVLMVLRRVARRTGDGDQARSRLSKGHGHRDQYRGERGQQCKSRLSHHPVPPGRCLGLPSPPQSTVASRSDRRRSGQADAVSMDSHLRT